MKRRIIIGGLVTVAVLAIGAGGLWYAVYGRGAGPRVNVLIPHGEDKVMVMDFSRPFSLNPPPPGWYHRKFLARGPMQMSFQEKAGVPALRLETHGGGSMLFRHVDIDLTRYPILTWRWYIEQPIESSIDERTRAGDDHPARLFIAIRTAEGKTRMMEVIWGNKVLKKGDYKFIGRFPHYVADGGDENAHQWIREEINLRKISDGLWRSKIPARVVEIALFCDSDDTGTQSVSYFADVEMKRRLSTPK